MFYVRYDVTRCNICMSGSVSYTHLDVYKRQNIENFKYLGTAVNNQNTRTSETAQRMQVANYTCFLQLQGSQKIK